MSDEYDYEERQRALGKLRRNAEFSERSDSVRSDRGGHDKFGSRTSSGYGYADRPSQQLSRNEEVPKQDFRRESIEQPRQTVGSRVSSGYGDRTSQQLRRDDELPQRDFRRDSSDHQHQTVGRRTSRTYGRQESDAQQQRQTTDKTHRDDDHSGDHRPLGTRSSATYGHGQQSLRQLGRSTDLGENGNDHHHHNGNQKLVIQEEDIRSDHSSDQDVKASKKIAAQKSRRDSSSSSDGDRKGGGRVQQQVQKQESVQKKERPPLQRDSTQRSVSKDDNDWAKRNQGARNKVLGLISRFNQGEAFKKEDARPSYKNDYGIGRQPGQIRQDKWQ